MKLPSGCREGAGGWLLFILLLAQLAKLGDFEEGVEIQFGEGVGVCEGCISLEIIVASPPHTHTNRQCVVREFPTAGGRAKRAPQTAEEIPQSVADSAVVQRVLVEHRLAQIDVLPRAESARHQQLSSKHNRRRMPW